MANPFDETQNSANLVATSQRKKSRTKAIIVGTIVIVVAIIVAAIVIWVLGASKRTYAKALAAMNEGDYSTAINLLDTIRSYDTTEELLQKANYEMIIFECIDIVKTQLRNPSSMLVYGVWLGIREDTAISDPEYPACYIYLGAENAMGGYSEGHAYFTYVDDAYKMQALIDTLDEEELHTAAQKDNDFDIFFDYAACKMINKMKNQEEFILIKDFELERIQFLLESGTYQTVAAIK